MKKYYAATLLLALAWLGQLNAQAQNVPINVSEKVAAAVMTSWKDSLVMQPGKPVKWAYDEGVVLEEYLPASDVARWFVHGPAVLR